MTHEHDPLQQTGLAAGFADPVLDAQAAFRSVMAALAEPGTLHGLTYPAGLCPGFSPAMTALALTLADFETRLWLDDGANGAAAGYLRFHTGASVVDDPARASFAFVTRPQAMPRLSQFSQGTLDYPDTSTTVVIEVASLETGRGWWLAGPGIPGSRRLAAPPLAAGFAAELAANRALFPCGVDVVLCRDKCVAALPRSTRISNAQEA